MVIRISNLSISFLLDELNFIINKKKCIEIQCKIVPRICKWMRYHPITDGKGTWFHIISTDGYWEGLNNGECFVKMQRLLSSIRKRLDNSWTYCRNTARRRRKQIMRNRQFGSIHLNNNSVEPIKETKLSKINDLFPHFSK